MRIDRGGTIFGRGLLPLAALLVLTSWVRAEEKPNIVFIFADDQAYNTIHALGNEEVETPHLDRLVRRGMTFTHAYNQGSWSGAVCVASRTMLNTGRFVWRANQIYAQSEQVRQRGQFWSELLRTAGYDTYFCGKWHLRADAEKAFDFVTHVRPGMPNQTPAGYNRPLIGQEDPWKPWDPQFGGFWKGGKHWSEVVADDASDFLRQATERDAPFFMYLAFNAPHDPRQSPREFVERYPHEKIAIPRSYIPEYPFKDAIGCGKNLRDEQLGPFPRTEYAVQVHRQEYYAIITHMDQQIGRILDELERTGKADNTYIFFSADHGLAVGHHGLMGKQNMFDHSLRVPLIAVGPGIPADRRVRGDVYLQDIMPTTLDLADIAQPDYVQFRSLMPIIHGQRQRNYEAIYGGYLELQRAVIEDDYKLIMYPRIQKTVLYNLADDPDEMHDLSDDPKQSPRMQRLFATFRRLQEETGDELDLTTVYPELVAN